MTTVTKTPEHTATPASSGAKAPGGHGEGAKRVGANQFRSNETITVSRGELRKIALEHPPIAAMTKALEMEEGASRVSEAIQEMEKLDAAGFVDKLELPEEPTRKQRKQASRAIAKYWHDVKQPKPGLSVEDSVKQLVTDVLRKDKTGLAMQELTEAAIEVAYSPNGKAPV